LVQRGRLHPRPADAAGSLQHLPDISRAQVIRLTRCITFRIMGAYSKTTSLSKIKTKYTSMEYFMSNFFYVYNS
jgi:hypothetical protein